MDNKTQELLAKKFSKKFEEYNTKVLEELAKVIKQFDGLTYTEAYKLAQQLKYNKSYIDLVDELSKLTGKSKKEVTLVLEEVINQHIEFADTFFKAQSMKTPIYKNDKTLQDIVTSFVKVAGDEFSNIAKSTGFAFLDDTGHLKFMNMQETYYKVIDDCVYAISEGKETYKQAIRKTIDQLYQSGVKKIVYVNEGKQQYIQRLDAAVKRNILDGIRQVSNEAELELGKRFHADGIEVSVHSEPAPDHEYVQGHQFSTKKPSKNELSEWEKFQNDKDCYDIKGNFYPAVSVETGHDRRSIGQYNCYHTIFSIIVGISRPLYTEEQLQKIIDDNNAKVEIDGKEYTKYEVTQLQRGLERKIRQEKEAQMMYKTNNDEEMVLKHQLKVTQLTNKYKEISKKANLLEAPSKMAVSKYKPVSVKNLQEKPVEYKILNDSEIENLDKQTKKLKKELSKKQIEALSSYVGIGHKEINETIIYGKPKDRIIYNSVEEIKKDINYIDEIMKKSKINQNITTFRGLYGDFSKYKIGDTIPIEEFVSTSLNKNMAIKWATRKGKGGSLFEIQTPSGTNAIYIGDNFSDQNEKELLLNRGMQYEILNIIEEEKEGYGKYIKYLMKKRR